MLKTHYRSPRSLYAACGRAGTLPLLSGEIGEVTCRACLRTASGIKVGGTPKRTDGRNKIAVVLSDRAFESFQNIPKGERSRTISNYLESI